VKSGFIGAFYLFMQTERVTEKKMIQCDCIDGLRLFFQETCKWNYDWKFEDCCTDHPLGV